MGHCLTLLKLALVITAVSAGLRLAFDLGPTGWQALQDVSSPVLAKQAQTRVPGPRVIFRLDDVEQGVRETQVFEILAVFERHDAPVDVGIVPRANGRPSYALRRLKPYVARGSADIGIHGITHVIGEFDTRQSGIPGEVLLDGLQDVTRRIAEFYGVRPLAFLVPYDVFDEAGYDVVREAGLRIFSSQWQTDHHRGTDPVDFQSRTDEGGLYRLPAVDDAVSWDAREKDWGAFQPMSDLMFSMRASLEQIGVAVISLHPAAFQKANGATDEVKLEQLAELLDRAAELGRISTFRNWYCTYAGRKEPGRARRFCDQ